MASRLSRLRPEREVRGLGAGEQGRAEDEHDQGEQLEGHVDEVLEAGAEGDACPRGVEERHAAARIDDLADGVQRRRPVAPSRPTSDAIPGAAGRR